MGGKTYYYDQYTNQPVTGIQSIDNKLYYFDANGVQQDATFGIDVSKYQSNIDWEQVKTAGVKFVIIRIGYRGYGSGALVLDPMFEQHFTTPGTRASRWASTSSVRQSTRTRPGKKRRLRLCPERPQARLPHLLRY